MFWQIPDDPRGALRWSLSRIRQIVDADSESWVRADRNLVTLDAARFDCDFRQIAGLKPEQVEKLDVASMEALAEVFKGGFLEDLYLPNCAEFEAWRVAQAEEVEMLRLRALRVLIDRLREDPQRALRHAFVLHALAPTAGLAAEIECLTSQARQLAAAASPDHPAPLPHASHAPPSKEERKPIRLTVADQMRRQVSVLAAEIVTPFQRPPGSGPRGRHRDHQSARGSSASRSGAIRRHRLQLDRRQRHRHIRCTRRDRRPCIPSMQGGARYQGRRRERRAGQRPPDNRARQRRECPAPGHNRRRGAGRDTRCRRA